MKAVKKQYVLIQVGKDLKWAQVYNKKGDLYYISVVMNGFNDRMESTCLPHEILAVSDINVTVREFDVKLGLK